MKTYPSARDLEEQKRQRVLDIFSEELDEEDFLGFSDTACSAPSGGWVPGPKEEPNNYATSSDSNLEASSSSQEYLLKTLIYNFRPVLDQYSSLPLVGFC